MKNAMFVVITMGIWGILAAAALADTVVTFPDPALDALIRGKINKPTGDILDTDLAGVGLTSLSGVNRAISNLSGLEYCTDLKYLALGGNQIVDMSPVSALVQLTCLSLDDNQISDMSPVASLSRLKTLCLSSNHITDMSAVATLSALTSLQLCQNAITDMSAVANLGMLTDLRLYSNVITDISAVSGLANLSSLWLSSNEISDMSPVSGLIRLTNLVLGGNRITDISAVSGLVNLTSLWMSANAIVDISPVARLDRLSSLNLGWNRIEDISALAGLTDLTSLYLDRNQIVEIGALSGLSNLTVLWLNSNQVVDISAISSLTALSTLELGSNQIENLNPLVTNSDIGEGDSVNVCANPLNHLALCLDIPMLQERGAFVQYTGECTVEGDVEGETEGEGAGEEGEGPSVDGPHGADLDQDWQISLSELMRVIQFFNSGGYHCDPSGEDGYHAGAGDLTDCGYHDSDYAPSDGQISVRELLRLVQFFNRDCYVIADEVTEDGYAPCEIADEYDFHLIHNVSGGNTVLQGQSVDITWTLQYRGEELVTVVAVTEILPEGWTFDGWIAGPAPYLVSYNTGDNILDAIWIYVPSLPFSISFRATPPADALGLYEFRGKILGRTSGPQLESAVSVAVVEIVADDK